MDAEAFDALVDELYAVLTDDDAFGKIASKLPDDKVLYVKTQFAELLKHFGIRPQTTKMVNFVLFFGQRWRSPVDFVLRWYCGISGVEVVEKQLCKSFDEAYSVSKFERILAYVEANSGG